MMIPRRFHTRLGHGYGKTSVQRPLVPKDQIFKPKQLIGKKAAERLGDIDTADNGHAHPKGFSYASTA